VVRHPLIRSGFGLTITFRLTLPFISTPNSHIHSCLLLAELSLLFHFINLTDGSSKRIHCKTAPTRQTFSIEHETASTLHQLSQPTLLTTRPRLRRFKIDTSRFIIQPPQVSFHVTLIPSAATSKMSQDTQVTQEPQPPHLFTDFPDASSLFSLSVTYNHPRLAGLLKP
jgi:hypothetical protein